MVFLQSVLDAGLFDRVKRPPANQRLDHCADYVFPDGGLPGCGSEIGFQLQWPTQASVLLKQELLPKADEQKNGSAKL